MKNIINTSAILCFATILCIVAAGGTNAMAQEKFTIVNTTTTRSNGIVTTTTNSYTPANKVSERTTLYTISGKPQSCEDNMKSLFKAWNTKNVTNAEDLKLVEYKSLGQVSNTKQAERYAKKMNSANYPLVSTSGAMGVENGVRTRTYNVKFETVNDVLAKAPADDKEKLKVELKQMQADLQQSLTQSIKVGYEAFVVKSMYKGTPMESLIFCDTKTYEVMVDLHFKGIQIE